MVVAALLVGLLASSGGATIDQAHPLSSLDGTIRDASGAALADVVVTLSGPAMTRVARTDLEGAFAFDEMTAGDYELTAVAAGFAPMRRSQRLDAGMSSHVALVLVVSVRELTVVTASKTGVEDAQTTPLQVTVMRGDTLARDGVTSVARLAGRAPNVTFSQNSDLAQLTIRGIGTNAVFAGSDPSSAVYLDGVYLARPVAVLMDFLALDRVEVVRGPQGTLYGRNAVGGAVNLVTKPPTDEVEASARATIGNLDAARVEARVSGPLVGHSLLGSVAVLRGVREGFVRDLDHPDHNLGGEEVTALQGRVHWALHRRADLQVFSDASDQDPIPLTYAKVLAVKPGFSVQNPTDVREVRASTLAEGHVRQGGVAARLTVRLPEAITLSSLTAYRRLNYRVVNDADITELNLAAVELLERQHQWSEELSLARQGARLSWVTGLFALAETDRQSAAIEAGVTRVENRIASGVESTSAAMFGQATWALTRRISATGGLRYTRERKTIANGGEVFTLDLPIAPLAGTAYAFRDANSHAAWTPKIGLEARLRDGLFGYVSATRGFKSGGFNATSREAGRGYAPEFAWSFESGLKTVTRQGRATLNLSVFHMDYTDLQVQTAIRPGVIDISNAAEATIRGVEVEGAVGIADGLRTGGHLAWLDTRYGRYIAVGVGGATGDVTGNQLTNAPEWSGRVWLEATGRAGPDWRWLLRTDARWQSTAYFTPFNDTIQRQPPYTILDVNGEVGPASGSWSVGVWARNLTDTDYITGTFSTPPPAIGGRPGLPREAGLQLTLAWDR